MQEAFPVGDVKYDQDAVGIAVVERRYRLKTFLSCRVPNLHLEFFFVDGDALREEHAAYRGCGHLLEPAGYVAADYRRFPDRGVSDEHQFELLGFADMHFN